MFPSYSIVLYLFLFDCVLLCSVHFLGQGYGLGLKYSSFNIEKKSECATVCSVVLLCVCSFVLLCALWCVTGSIVV